jgi:hypothetical protein
MTAMEWAKRSGWVVESPVRRRIGLAIVMAIVASSWSHWPSGAWHNAFSTISSVVLLGLWFWPPRRRPSSTGHAVGV